MLRLVLLLPLVAALLGCVPVATGGAGTTSRGQPVAGELSRDGRTAQTVVRLFSPSGLRCEAVAPDLPPGGPPRAVRTLPLGCADGRRGTIVMSGNQFQQQIVGSYRLDDGSSGQVTFGRT